MALLQQLNLTRHLHSKKLCHYCAFLPLTAVELGFRIKYNLLELIEEDPLYGYYK